MELFPIQKWSSVFIRYHKRARRGKYDRRQAGRRRDGKRLSGRKRLIFYGIPLSYQRDNIPGIEVIRNLKSQTPNIKENPTFQYPMTQTGLSF
jgi:hypothetical protein